MIFRGDIADVTFAQETESGVLIGVGANILAIVGTNNTAVKFPIKLL